MISRRFSIPVDRCLAFVVSLAGSFSSFLRASSLRAFPRTWINVHGQVVMQPGFANSLFAAVNSAIRNVVDRRILQNASALYGAKIANYLMPLIMVPYLARVLGPDTWGVVLFVQAIGMYLMMVVEYSFDLSATRQVARNQDRRELLARIVAGVLGARLVLAAVCIVVLALAQILVPTVRDTGWLLWLAVLWYGMLAIRPMWFFVGIERVGIFLAIEMSTKALAVGGTVLLVNRPADAWIMLALQGAATVVTVTAGTVMVYWHVPFRLPSLEGTIASLREGWNMFIYYLSSSMYSMSNTIILGFLAPSFIVGFYAGAERISRVLMSMMHPMLIAMFPRASGLASNDRGAAARLARTSTFIVFFVALINSVILYFMAPFIVQIILGPGYGESVHVLRILLILLPIVGVSIPLSMHWMIPNGLDRLLTRITISGGMLHIPLAILLGSQFSYTGIAWALVITETYIVTMILSILLLRGLGPFRLSLTDREAGPAL